VKYICDVLLSVWINDKGITLEFMTVKLFCSFQLRRSHRISTREKDRERERERERRKKFFESMLKRWWQSRCLSVGALNRCSRLITWQQENS